jgi:hypothetical protein
MKRLQIYIEEELDAVLAAESARTRTSKAALIREAVAARFASRDARRDPLDALVGSSDAAPASIDETVYGR